MSWLEEVGARINMAAAGNPHKDAKAESFFRTLKMEGIYLKDFRIFEETQENTSEFIEEFYTTTNDCIRASGFYRQ